MHLKVYLFYLLIIVLICQLLFMGSVRCIILYAKKNPKKLAVRSKYLNLYLIGMFRENYPNSLKNIILSQDELESLLFWSNG